MKRGILFFTLAILSFNLLGQIDMRDSTAQVISYWSLYESQNYKISETELVTSKEDTVSSVLNTYDLQIKVIDSTSAGYVLEWTRTNFQFSSSNALSVQLDAVLSNTPILLLSNIYGGDIQVLNWEDIFIHVNDKCSSLLTEYAGKPAALSLINQTIKRHSTKESIEAYVVRDVNQYFVYHGAKYKLGETVTNNVKIPNNYGGDPLDASTALVLDELLPENDTYIIKSFQSINPQQLTAVTYDYLSALNIVDSELPAYEDFPTVLKQIWGGSEIHSRTGWVIYSQESEQITSGEDITLKERIIELVN